MHAINVCFESQNKKFIEWLRHYYEVNTSFPTTSFALLLIDLKFLDKYAKDIQKLKEAEHDLFMPVLLVCSKEQMSFLNKHLDTIIDDVLIEPFEFIEARLRMEAFLKANELSMRVKQLIKSKIKLEIHADRLAYLTANVPGMIYQFAVFPGGGTRFEYISEGCKQIFEIEPEEAIKDPLLIVSTVHPDERLQFEKNLAEAIRECKTWIWEGRYIIKGKIKWIKGASSPHKAANALIWDGVMVDVTALKVAEEKVRDLAFFSEQIIDNTHEGLLVCDTEMRITKWNKSIEQISGLSREQVKGHHPIEVFPTLVQEGIYLHFEQALQGKRFQTRDYRFSFPQSGNSGWATSAMIPLRNSNDEINGLLFTIGDITDRKLSEEELRKMVASLQHKNDELTKLYAELDSAYSRLQNIDKAKSHFVSTASHEIRTPLTSILGFIQTILSPDIKISDSKRNEYLQIVKTEATRLSQLVETLLNISRLESGKQELKLSTFSLIDLARSILKTFKVHDKGITISIDEKDSGEVFADRQQIGQVIRNILDNAIRYTKPNSEIKIGVERTINEVIVSIKDQGPGIAPDQQKAIFEKFYRVNEFRTTPTSGSGLGLSIAQEIINVHHGRIWVISTLGEGSTFFFALPLGTNLGATIR